MSWINCLVDEDYEIYNEFPYYIRRKSNKRVVKEHIHHEGFPRITLNGVSYAKHRIIAIHFIPNDDPLVKTEVDHINHDRTDYHLENLRWVTHKQNSLNRTSSANVNYEFIDYEETPDDLIQVNDYGKHEFEDYYYSPDNNNFYFDNGVNLRVLHVNFDKGGRAYVNMMNNQNKKVNIYYNKFKKIYGFD